MQKIKLKKDWLTIGLLILLLAACYPNEDFFVEELDLVVTNYDVDEDYSRFRTFAVHKYFTRYSTICPYFIRRGIFIAII